MIRFLGQGWGKSSTSRATVQYFSGSRSTDSFIFRHIARICRWPRAYTPVCHTCFQSSAMENFRLQVRPWPDFISPRMESAGFSIGQKRTSLGGHMCPPRLVRIYPRPVPNPGLKSECRCDKLRCMRARVGGALAVQHFPFQPELEELVVYLVRAHVLRDEVLLQQSFDSRDNGTRRRQVMPFGEVAP